MTAPKVRAIFRWTHIFLGLVLLCYVYSPFHQYIPFQIFIKFFAIPTIVISGLWLWKPQIFNRLLGAK